MTKLYDLCVATRHYKDTSGNDKAVWENIGTILKNEDGKTFMMLKAHFNPAATCINVRAQAPPAGDRPAGLQPRQLRPQHSLLAFHQHKPCRKWQGLNFPQRKDGEERGTENSQTRRL